MIWENVNLRAGMFTYLSKSTARKTIIIWIWGEVGARPFNKANNKCKHLVNSKPQVATNLKTSRKQYDQGRNRYTADV